MAGEAGLEPAHPGVKVLCLTNLAIPQYGGPSWIRTRVLRRDQIYSLAVLASSPKDPYKRLSLTTPRVLYTKWYMENLHTTRYSICKGTLRVRPAGAPSQNRTGTDSRPWDFKSHASACSAKGAYAPRFFHVRCAALTDGCLANHNLVHKERFELSNTSF